MRVSRMASIMVGLMVIVGFGLFLATALILGRWQQSSNGYTINVEFRFLNNLIEGNPVYIAGGIKSGYVEKIYQENLKTYAKLHINEELRDKLPKKEGMQFAIYTVGLMGQKYINLTIPPIEEGDEFYQDGDTVKGLDPPSVDEMIMAFSSWFEGKNGGQVLAEIMQETRQFVNNLNAIVLENRGDIRVTVHQAKESLVTLSKQLDELMIKLNVLTQNFSDISTRNKQDIEVMLENMSKISRDLNLVTQRMNNGRGSAGKFITDEALYDNATDAVANARDLFRLLNEKPYLLMYKEN